MAGAVVITGAAGNLGGKLRRHLAGRRPLLLLDRDPRGDPEIRAADLAVWDPSWVDLLHGADALVHLAADPTAQQAWPQLVGPNVDAVIHVLLAAAQARLRRVVLASSNHVLGGYMHRTERLTLDLPPLPGARYVVHGEQRDSTPYGSAKLFLERLGQAYAERFGLSVVAVRLGWVLPGANRPGDIPPTRDEWFRLMWLSNRDYLHLVDRCLEAELAEPFTLVNGMSANTGMRWDLDETRRRIGYQPRDDVTRQDRPDGLEG